MKRLIIYLISLGILLYFPQAVHSQTGKIFKTKYTTIYYNENKDIDDFIWRLGGQRIEFPVDRDLASNRVDRIVSRVETILDMHPRRFNVDIYLHRGPLETNEAAFYDPRMRSIHISVESTSDGVLAHEVAHAVVNQFFGPTTPSKIQEILTQYVDKYLWSDY